MSENAILHYGAVKARVVGSGNLRISLLGYDDILSATLEPIAMATTKFRQEQRLCNFVSQQAMVRIETTGIDEYMIVNSVTVFVKGIFSEYPQ